MLILLRIASGNGVVNVKKCDNYTLNCTTYYTYTSEKRFGSPHILLIVHLV